jgi:hypothetical protein
MLTLEQKEIIIRKARNRISAAAHWCIGANARTADGIKCNVDDLEADEFCGTGALIAEALPFCNGNISEAEVIATDIIADICPGRWLTDINDVYGHKAVLELFDKALNGIAMIKALAT